MISIWAGNLELNHSQRDKNYLATNFCANRKRQDTLYSVPFKKLMNKYNWFTKIQHMYMCKSCKKRKFLFKIYILCLLRYPVILKNKFVCATIIFSLCLGFCGLELVATELQDTYSKDENGKQWNKTLPFPFGQLDALW